MAILAINGHPFRGKEVIERLEMLGGINKYNYSADCEKFYFYIDEVTSNIVYLWLNNEEFYQFTLEKFLEKYPHKIGDKVTLTCLSDVSNQIRVITSMRWTGETVVYSTDFEDSEFEAIELQPYWEKGIVFNVGEKVIINGSEEIISEVLTSNVGSIIYKIQNSDKFFSGDMINKFEYKESEEIKLESSEDNVFNPKLRDDTKWSLPEGYEFQDENGNMIPVKEIILVKKSLRSSFPKNYEECYKILFPTSDTVSYSMHGGYLWDKTKALSELLLCRDAYWKLLDDWEPNYESLVDKTFYTIHRFNGEIVKSSTSHRSSLLVFPSEEIRDLFYENFEELIHQCKILL